MKFIPSLNALRFIGALAVITTHLGLRQYFVSHGLAGLDRVFNGTNGVTLFYVLSGFLLTNLAISEVRNSGTFSLRKFYLRRALRLFPLYYLAIFTIYLLDKLQILQVSKQSYGFALVYAYNFVPRSQYAANLGSFHTLGNEEQFYLFFGIAFFFITNWARQTWKLWIPSVFAFLLLTLGSLRPLFSDYENTYFVSRWIFFAVQPILIGALTAFIWRSQWFEKKVVDDRFQKLLSRLALLGLILAVLTIAADAQQKMPTEIILGFGFALLIIALVADQGSALAKALSTNMLVYLGTISYGLYVWQAVFLGTGPPARWIHSPWLATSLVFIVAMASYRFYEKPFLNWKAKLRG